MTIYDSNNPANDGLTEGIKGQDWDVIDGKLVVYTDPVAIPSDELQALIDDGTLHTIEAGTLEAGSSSSEDGTTGPFGTGTITVMPGGTLDTADETVSNEVVVIVAEVPGTGGGTTDTTSGGSSSGPSIALGCTDDRRIGEVVTCTVTGGPVDHEMLWEAAYNPVFATGPVLLGADGSGTFSFTVPAEALGELITATLVGWGVSALLGMGGTVGDADTTLIPSRIDAGGGPMPPPPMPAAIMTVLLGTMVAVLQRDRRLVRAGASSEEPLEPDPDPAPEPDLGLDRLAVLAEELRIAYEAVERGD